MEKYSKILLKIEKHQIPIQFQNIILNKSKFELKNLTFNGLKNLNI